MCSTSQILNYDWIKFCTDEHPLNHSLSVHVSTNVCVVYHCAVVLVHVVVIVL